LVQSGPVKSHVALSLCRKVSSAGGVRERKALCRDTPRLILLSGPGVVEENMNTHLPQALEFPEKRFVFVAVFFEKPDDLGRVFKLTA
jgi:hypothetical protein